LELELKQWQINRKHLALYGWGQLRHLREKGMPIKQQDIINIDSFNESLSIRLKMEKCRTVMIKIEED
jgi:hypothetical protein